MTTVTKRLQAVSKGYEEIVLFVDYETIILVREQVTFPAQEALQSIGIFLGDHERARRDNRPMRHNRTTNRTTILSSLSHSLLGPDAEWS